MEQQCNKMKVGGSTIVCQAPLLIRQEILVIKTSFSHIIVKSFCINNLATILRLTKSRFNHESETIEPFN